MKIGDLVTGNWNHKDPPIGVLIAIHKDVEYLEGHVLVFWLNGTWKGSTKPYRPKHIKKIKNFLTNPENRLSYR